MSGHYGGKQPQAEVFGGMPSTDVSVPGSTASMPTVLHTVVPMSPFLTHSIQSPGVFSASIPSSVSAILVGGRDPALASLPSPVGSLSTAPTPVVGGMLPGSPGLQRNVVFEWQSGSSPMSPNARRRTEVGSQSTQRLAGLSPSAATRRRASHHSQAEHRQSSKPSSSHVQTTVQTATVTPTAGGVYEQSPRAFSPQVQERAALFEQLTQQLEDVHQEFRDGGLEAKEYHKKVADLMVQLHTFHGSPVAAGNFLSNLPTSPNSNVVVLQPGVQLLQSVSPSVAQASIGSTALGQTALGQAPRLVSGPSGFVVTPPAAGYTSPQAQSPQGLPLNIMTMPVAEPQTTTTTTTTTVKRSREPSTVDPLTESASLSASIRTRPSASTRKLMAHGLTCADLLLALKLVQGEDPTVAANQVVALLYTLLPDVASALEWQLKLPEDSVSLSPALRSVFTSTKAACAMASELGSYASSLYKTLKRCGISGLRAKHNRLRILANEAKTRRWKGRELVEFIASLLNSIDVELKPEEKIFLIESIVSKLGKRAGDALSELYNIFNIVFPNCFDDALSRLSALHDVRGHAMTRIDAIHHHRTASIVSFNEPCQVCHDPCLGFRYRCLDCHPEKRSGSGEYLLCGVCFIARFYSKEQRSPSGGIIDHEIHRRSGRELDHSEFHHSKPTTYDHAFVCEVPASVFLSEHRSFRPLSHVTIAPNQGWWSSGAVVPMIASVKHRMTGPFLDRRKQNENSPEPLREGSKRHSTVGSTKSFPVDQEIMPKQESVDYDAGRFEEPLLPETLKPVAGGRPLNHNDPAERLHPSRSAPNIQNHEPSVDALRGVQVSGSLSPSECISLQPEPQPHTDLSMRAASNGNSDVPMQNVEDVESLRGATVGSLSDAMTDPTERLDHSGINSTSMSDEVPQSEQRILYGSQICEDDIKEFESEPLREDSDRLARNMSSRISMESGGQLSGNLPANFRELEDDRVGPRDSMSQGVVDALSQDLSGPTVTDKEDGASDDDVFECRDAEIVDVMPLESPPDVRQPTTAARHSLAEDSVETQQLLDHRPGKYAQEQVGGFPTVGQKDSVAPSRSDEPASAQSPREKQSNKPALLKRHVGRHGRHGVVDSPSPLPLSANKRSSEDKAEMTPRSGRYRNQAHSFGSSSGKFSPGTKHPLKTWQTGNRVGTGGRGAAAGAAASVGDDRNATHGPGFAGPLPGRRSRALGEGRKAAGGMRF